MTTHLIGWSCVLGRYAGRSGAFMTVASGLTTFVMGVSRVRQAFVRG